VYGIGFYAKGSENTDKLYVEIRDSFNSRWYAVVGVDDEWGLKMLYASDFVFWDGPASSVKAGPAMNSLTSISIGFAKSGADYETGAHDFYLGNVSLYRYSDKMAHGSAPTLDCVSPEYEVYPVTNAESLQVSRNQIFLTEREYTLPQSAISCFPGRQGLGYDKGRANRFVPLLEYVSDKGLHSGYAAYMNLYSSTSGRNGDYEGCIVASFTPCGNDFYDKNGICAVVDVATAMMNDFFLIEGGSDELIYPVQDGGRMTAGATCVSSAQVSDVNAQMTVSLYKGTELIKEWKSGKDCQMSQLKSGIFTMKGEYAIPGDCPDRVVTVLSCGGRVIDRIEQSIRLWTPKPESERRYITTSNGHFIRDGKILNLFGVNYMPSTSTAEADEKDFDRYVMSSSYDPDVVHNDLLRIKEVGFNAISVYVHYDSIMNSNNILDLIMQCEDLGFYVDLSIRPNAYPMTYSESEVETLIRKLHFDQIDTIAAYDIAWEKRVDRYSVDGVVTLRQQWDGDWRKWIADQYGSLSAAEKIWGCSAPRNSSGEVIGATDEMLLDTSGVYDRLVAAYRRFVDDKVAQVFIKATEHMRALDPNHLISFRMAYSGSPNYPSNYYAYDYQSLASSMDFMSPEAYAIGDDDESALQVVFANAYARYAAPDKPVVWKEFGYSVWTGSNFNRSNHKLQQQYDLYSQTLKYIYQCDTAGVYVWFYGNYRINENSDYGFLNPDGSDRPATALLREYAPKFLGQTEDFKADVLIEVERDYYPGGISGMYPAIKEQLREAFAEGKKVAFVNAVQKSENQKFYADEVLDKTIHGDRGADGDTSPLRYVNGMIYGLETERSDGKVYCTVTVCNTLQAAWRSGSVSVVSTEDSQISVDTVITDEVDYLGVTRVRFEVPGSGALKLRLSVGGYEFGSVFTAQIWR
ncbi:MAG: beta-galactosidase, partial [Eubacteriales bacterium]